MHDFGKWIGVNDTPDQLKRFESAMAKKLTPVSVDVENKCGVFKGSAMYKVTLESCNCSDYVHRKLPCKHMYRLAAELGELDDAKPAAYTEQPMTLEECVAIVENLSEPTISALQEVLKSILYCGFSPSYGCVRTPSVVDLITRRILNETGDVGAALARAGRNDMVQILTDAGISGFKKNMKQIDLVQWVIDNVPDAYAVFRKYVAVGIGDSFSKAARKVYTYLIRRNDCDICLDEDMIEYEIPKGAEYCGTDDDGEPTYRFPDDEVTALLDKYGKNRCRDMIGVPIMMIVS